MEREQDHVYGGLILRRQLILLLQKPECFSKYHPHEGGRKEEIQAPHVLSYQDWLRANEHDHHKHKRKDGEIGNWLTEEELDSYIDLSPYLNPSAVSIREDFTLASTYEMFKALGLRHIVVLAPGDQVAGIITRQDLLEHNIVARAAPRFGWGEHARTKTVTLCPTCGTRGSDTAKFCDQCGSKIQRLNLAQLQDLESDDEELSDSDQEA